MDEFTAMGKVPMLAKSIAFIAGYGLRMLPIVQSLEQIVDVYGREAAANFIKNHEVKVIFPPDDIDEAERVSRSLGYLTERARSTGFSRSSGFDRSSNVSRNENISEQRRALLLPQEIRELPPHQELIFKPNCKPILAHKIRYYDDPAFVPRLLPPIEVPVMDMGLHQAIVEQRVRPLAPEEARNIDLNRLAIDTAAIATFTGDPQNPTKEEAEAVVESFFAQLDWETEPEAPTAQVLATEDPPVARVAGRIDLSLLES
jgi:type IV secretion system protein VirD4